MDSKGHVTVMDFGLAQLTQASLLTRPDQTMGTTFYMSPEQTEGSGTDHRTDIWSLGVVLYEMVTGQRPFKGDYDKAVMYSILNEEPEQLTGLRTALPVELEVAVNKALAKQPSERYQNAGDMVVDLKGLQKRLESSRSDVLASAPTSAGDLGARHPTRAAKLAWVVAAALAVCTVSLAYIQWGDAERAPPRVARRLPLIPESVGAPPYSGAPSISPDGRMFVYRADEPKTRLWLWSFADGRARPLEGTENAGSVRPFWSADSRRIGFADQDRQSLLRLELDSSSTTRICTLDDIRIDSAAWSPDGNRIVFSAGGRTYSLYSTPAMGGEPQPIKVSLQDSPDWSVSDPHFLPTPASQTHVLVSAGSIAGSRSAYLLDLASGSVERLIEGSEPVYALSGHVLVRRNDSSVWALPFSADKRLADGDAFPMAEGFSTISVSAEGSLILAQRPIARRSATRYQLILHNRNGDRIAEIGSPLYRMVDPAVSPDGRRVVVSGAKRLGGDSDLWLFDIGRKTERRLTTEPGIDDGANWHPNGTEIAYRSQGEGAGDLFAISIEGPAGRRPLVQSPVRESTPRWSRTGDGVLYQMLQSDGVGMDIHYLRGVETGQLPESAPFLTSGFNEFHGGFSPDGRYLSYGENSSGTGQIYVRAFPEGSSVWQISERGGSMPRWGRDGKELFWNEAGVLMRAAVDFSQASPVSDVQALLEEEGLDFSTFCYDVTPDGNFVITVPLV